MTVTKEVLEGVKFHIHKPLGAFFLWLWFHDLFITDTELYERLKNRNVLVVPGNYFFQGFKQRWPHKNQYIRINYSQQAPLSKALK